MSEIFQWLKKAGHQRDELLLEDESPAPSPPAFRPEFNLELADRRIKIVLDPLSAPGEQFRFLRTTLGRLQRQGSLKTLLVTSSVPGEGKTFTACSLAGILAQEPEKRVMLIDADLRNPRVAEKLGMEVSPTLAGLADVLKGNKEIDDVLVRSEVLGLAFVYAGRVPTNPSELLASDNLEAAIHRAAEIADWVVIDTPPVLAFADATRMATLCDGVLLVVQANSTPAKLVQKALQTVGRERVAGVVLNRVRHHPGSRYYYKRYSKKGQD